MCFFGGDLQIDAKNSYLDIFESALYGIWKYVFNKNLAVNQINWLLFTSSNVNRLTFLSTNCSLSICHTKSEINPILHVHYKCGYILFDIFIYLWWNYFEYYYLRAVLGLAPSYQWKQLYYHHRN